MIKNVAFGLVLTAALSAAALGQATDNFENDNPTPAYNDGIQFNDNGGTGFGPLTYLGGDGGGIFDGNIGTGRALGIFAGSGSGNTQAVGRSVTDAVVAGEYSLTLRFDLSNASGSSGFNLKSALGTSFGGGELLFVGLTPGSGNNVLFVSDGTGSSTFAVGTLTELRGTTFAFTVSFDTLSLAYTVTATSGSQTGSFTGTLKDTNGATAGTDPLGAVAFGNFNGGTADQNLIADNLSITAVPEPSTLSLLAGPAILGAWFFVRRRRA